MKTLAIQPNGGVPARIPCITPLKLLLAVGFLCFGLQSSRADAFLSPRATELFGQMTPMVVLPPGQKIRLVWDFPVSKETPDLIFKVYHSRRIGPSFESWLVLTNVPGNLRSVDLPAIKTLEFFVLTASNYLGESSFATR
jgi:hypothetical protein